jgi:hypothetical protein
MYLYRAALALLLIIFTAGISLPQEVFEGKVDYKISDGSESTILSYFVKDGKMKIDVSAEQNASMIYNSKNKTMLVIMPEQKMYMEMPIDLHKDMDGEEGSKESKEIDGEFTQTGEKKDILGYTCEKWVYSDNTNQIEAWLTQELGSFMFFTNPMEGEVPEWQTRLEKGGYFPMDVIVKESAGGSDTRMQVIAVEKTSLNDDMFAPPAGYQKLDMPMGR